MGASESSEPPLSPVCAECLKIISHGAKICRSKLDRFSCKFMTSSSEYLSSSHCTPARRSMSVGATYAATSCKLTSTNRCFCATDDLSEDEDTMRRPTTRPFSAASNNRPFRLSPRKFICGSEIWTTNKHSSVIT